MTATLATLAVLLVAPVAALARLAPHAHSGLLAGVPLALSLATFLAYRSDKHRAARRAPRVPEMTLHLAALLGGWPGAFLGQRVFRHKTQKTSFQAATWTVVLLHQAAAVDCLLDWRFARQAARALLAAA